LFGILLGCGLAIATADEAGTRRSRAFVGFTQLTPN
jgi:hypothetical protein